MQHYFGMYKSHGERHADILDQGLELARLFPPEYVVSIGSMYSGKADDRGMLILDQSPHLPDPEEARLRMLDAIAGIATIHEDDEGDPSRAKSIVMPDGTHVHIQEPSPVPRHPYRSPREVIEACKDISSFIRGVEGLILRTQINFDTGLPDTTNAEVRGVCISNDMWRAYLASIKRGLAVKNRPNGNAQTLHHFEHAVLTQTGQAILFLMGDGRQAPLAEEVAAEWREQRAQRLEMDPTNDE